MLSSDTYCVFIALEGLTAAYAATGDHDIRAAILDLARLVEAADLPGCRAQLHASLTAARCLRDVAERTGDTAPLRTAERIYRLFTDTARTANDATYNWFGRPDSWTEPCAIVDALLLAIGLWHQTGAQRYLDDAHLILHNGLGHAQRNGGGFGCDSCTGADEPDLSVVIPDASWCCTMRGAVGLAAAVEAAYAVTANTVEATLFSAGTTTLRLDAGSLTLDQRTGYPAGETVTLQVTAAELAGPVTVGFAVPSWAAPATLSVNGAPVDGSSVRRAIRPGDRYELRLEHRRRTEAVGTGGSVRHLHGPLLLGSRGGAAELTPVRDAFCDPADQADPADASYRVVFPA